MSVIEKVKEALKVYNAEDVRVKVFEGYRGFEVHCNIQDKHIRIGVIEHLRLTGMSEICISSRTLYNVQEGKTMEAHTYIYNCEVRSILRTVTIALENLLE